MYGNMKVPPPLPWQYVNRFLFFSITLSIVMTSTLATAVSNDIPVRNERAAVMFSDQGNILYDNGTLVFDAAVNEDVEVYLLGDEDYKWTGIGHRAAGWVRDGVIKAVPPDEFIALIKKHLTDESDIQSTVKEALVIEMPVIITSFMLLIMAVIMPVVGLIFCCCRCAGKCGGIRKEEDIVSMETTRGVVLCCPCCLLIVVCVFIGTMSSATKPSIIRMVDSVDHTGTVANNILADVETFKDDFILDLNRLGIDDLGFVTEAVYAKLDDVGGEVASPLLGDTAPYLTTMSETVDNLEIELTSFSSDGSALDMLLQTSVNLVSAGQSLVDALDIAKANLTAIRDDCLADPTRVGAGVCDNIPDPSSLDTSSVDFSTINLGDLDLNDIRNELQVALATIRGLMDTGNNTLQDVPELITNSSVSSIDGIRDAITQLEEVVEGLVNQTSESLNEIFDSLDFDLFKERIDTTVQLPVEKSIINTIASVLPVILAFMVILTGVGLLVALIGLKCNDGPRRRGSGCDCGGKMLMGSVCWSFSISLFICILSAIFLLIGSTLTIVCDSLLDLSLIHEIVDDPAVWGGSSLTSRFSFGNSTFNITVYEILENCQEDATLFRALDLGSSGFLDVVFDLDIRGMLPDLTSVYEMVNDTVSALDILPSDQADDLLSQLTGQLSPSNITHSIQEMQSGLGQIPLANLSDALNDGADAVDTHYPDMASNLRDLADDLVNINNQQLQLTINMTVSLLEEVSRLNASIAGVEIVAEEVSGSVSNLATFIQTDAGPIVIQSLEAYIDSIISLADQFIDEVLRRIQDDMGRCGIVRNIYDAVVGSLCLYLLPGLNVFWFALSAISFALIPNIVFNVRLAKYLRSPTHSVPRESAPFNGVAVYPPTPTGTPQSSIRGSPASMRRPVDESLVNVRIPRSVAARFSR